MDMDFEVTGTGADAVPTPKFKGYKQTPRPHLVFIRAMASWSLDYELNEDNLMNLVPLSVHDVLMEIIYSNTMHGRSWGKGNSRRLRRNRP